ncbi:sulfite exporter TauE/SafE family protein [Aquamicrobium defluvii]|uniref:Probable membrane transporter protein n=1 Tax=Aquamicrobium defluvii TaxID=69279 RepID=A0A011UFL5_9HYPH|nr:sulfite exporter TauE/SafE family protein [Aquamicrobium defluvii]EXL04931.1 membrane protein [Aquamicrobium defluvii]EZQ14561.1 membrane protein [Halopseudomonas bauzanensis]
MNAQFLIWLIAGAAAGGFVSGLAGFGTALFTLVFWLKVMPPQQAVAIVLIMSVTSGLQGVYLVRHAIVAERWRLLRFLLPALIGVPIGIALLGYVDARALKLVIGAFMLLYGTFFIARRSLPVFERRTHAADIVVGHLSGILGGAASLSGALPTMWCALRPWTKAEQRAVLQPFSVVVLAVTATILAIKGAYNTETLMPIGIALPITLLSTQLGITVYWRLEDKRFKRLLIGLMFVSGLSIVLGEIVSLGT